MSIFRKRCAYCGVKVDKSSEIVKKVKVPQFVDHRVRVFCSEAHVAKLHEHVTNSPRLLNLCLSCPYPKQYKT